MSDHEDHEDREDREDREDNEQHEAQDDRESAAVETPPLRRVRQRRRALPRWAWITGIGVCVGIALAVIAVAIWLNWPKTDETSVVTVHGVEYVTNVQVEDHNGYAYVQMPVNSDTASVVLEVADSADNEKIREFLDGLDTLMPGEHVLSLNETNLHFIVDGIDEVE